MKQTISIIVILFCTGIILAQETCPAIDESRLSALEICEDTGIGSICYAAGELSLESDVEEVTFENAGDTVLLSDVIALESTSEESLALLQLNREDVSLRLIAYGEISLENAAPRSSINVYALRGVNLRQEPSVEATVVGSLIQGRDYTAVGRLADNTWLQVQLEDGRIGWSSAQYFVTQDGFTALETVTPNTPAYLPMQALTLQTGDCAGLLLIAPEIEEETIIFGINGAQIEVQGIAWLQANEDELSILNIAGDSLVNAFGFEMPLEPGEITSIPLNDSLSIAGIPSDAESSDVMLLEEETNHILLAGEGVEP